MQPTDLSDFPNSTNWEVKQDGGTQLYYLQNIKGAQLQGRFVTRRDAEQKLYNHLKAHNIAPGPGRGHKSEHKKVPTTN